MMSEMTTENSITSRVESWPFEAQSWGNPDSLALDLQLDPVLGRVVKRTLLIKAELLRQDDGGYVIHVPSLPCASTQGTDLEDALRMVKESIRGVLEAASGAIPWADEIEYLTGRDSHVMISVSVDDLG
jgi:predicted RNase H-like HicB family nuclease